MNGFRILLLILLLAVVGYTVPVVINHGFGLFGVFFGDIGQMAWPGQFNFDFLGFLVLSGTWMAWRNNFSPFGLLLGVGGIVGGIPLLATYLLIESKRVDDDWMALVFGPKRAQQLLRS